MRYQRLAASAIVLVFSIAALAVTPQFWESFTQEDLLKGNLNRISLSYDGKLFPAPAYDLIYDTGQSYIFSMVGDKAGNVYLGTGDEGKVFKVDAQGKGSLYFQSKEMGIFAMALDASNTLYVGSSPDGKIYKVTGPNQAAEFCNPEDKYIWSMVFDSADNLYVGTGANGSIYKVDKSGKKELFYTCSDNHAVNLMRGNNNNLLAGTSPNGLVVEITPEGKGFTLLDAPLEEVHSLAMDRFGVIYAVAAASRGVSASSATKSEAAAGKISATIQTVISVQAAASLSEASKEIKASNPSGDKESSVGKSAIYAISKDGSVETIYSSNEQAAFDAIARSDGSLLVATGPKGRLLSINIAGQISIVTDTPEEDLTRMYVAGDAVYVACSNKGKLYKLQAQKAQSGVFESKILDAKAVASWGKISWTVANPDGVGFELSTRTGNREKPDKSWSDWSDAVTTVGQQIVSPRARYLQWRVSYKRGSSSSQGAAADMLHRVQIAYLQQNLRPQVSAIDVLPYGVELQKSPSLAAGGSSMYVQSSTPDGRSLNAPRERGKERQPIPPRQMLSPGAQSFTWKADDDNNDSLEYSLYFKGEEESDWKALEKKITDNFYTLGAASLPDGIYRLKVVVSDAPSNPYDKFLIGELISDPFVIVNCTPQIEITGNKVNARKVEAQFRARAATGNIATAEFSIDGGEWNLVFPADGIADSAQEDYRVSTAELPAGEHLIGIRASDRDGNTGASKLVVKIP